MGTQDELITDLMKKPKNALRDQIISDAAQGAFHDFKSDHPTPKVALVGYLEKYGYRDLARKAKRGDYDERPDEEDNAMMDAMLAKDPRLAAIWEKMSLTKDPEEAFKIISEHLTPEERAAAAEEMGGPTARRRR